MMRHLFYTIESSWGDRHQIERLTWLSSLAKRKSLNKSTSALHYARAGPKPMAPPGPCVAASKGEQRPLREWATERWLLCASLLLLGGKALGMVKIGLLSSYLLPDV